MIMSKTPVKITKNFSDVEVLPDVLWGYDWRIFMNPVIINIAQVLRNEFGSITINNKYWGGRFNWSGYRTRTSGVGAKFSQHKFGRALDLKFKDATPIEVQNYIIENEEMFYKLGLRRLEDANITKTWLHIDTMSANKFNKIHVFKP